MQSKKNWMAGFLIAMLIVGSGWLVSNAPAAIDSTAKLIADLRTDLTKAKSGSVNYTNDVSGVILIRENLILPKAINYTNDVSGVILIRENLILPKAINYTNDATTVVRVAYNLAITETVGHVRGVLETADTTYATSLTGAVFHEATLRTLADLSYATSLTGAIFHEGTIRNLADVTYAASFTGAVFHEKTLRTEADGVLAAADVTYAAAATGYTFHTNTLIRADFASADAGVLAGAINYTNDATATVRTYADGLTANAIGYLTGRDVYNLGRAATYSDGTTSGLVTRTKSTATPVLAGLTVNGNVDATLFRHPGGSLLSNEWINYTNDATATVRTYADSITTWRHSDYSPRFARLGVGQAVHSIDIESITQTASSANSKGLNVLHSGTGISGWAVGVSSVVSGTNTFNAAGYFGASGGTNNVALMAEGLVLYDDSRGYASNLGKMTTSLSEMSSNTLLDKSRSTLTCTGGVLTYTLIAVDGSGTWNFEGVVYPQSVASASVSLTGGTDSVPKTNYVYYELQAGVPTLVAATVEPTTVHIDVATWIVGTVSAGSPCTYTIYAYSRNRSETETFINRSLARFEEEGALYSSGFIPTVTQTTLNIAGGGKFYNGVFSMTSLHSVSAAGGFYFINSAGQFVQGTTFAALGYYSDGSALGGNERANIVWGIVPTTTTAGGTTSTVVRLVAVLQSKPAVAYDSDALARQDTYEATNYYPSNIELQKVFVPIARTIICESNYAQLKTFATGLYHKDLRGKITSGGGAATPADTSGLVPYVGANAKVNLGVYGLTGQYFNATTATIGLAYQHNGIPISDRWINYANDVSQMITPSSSAYQSLTYTPSAYYQTFTATIIPASVNAKFVILNVQWFSTAGGFVNLKCRAYNGTYDVVHKYSASAASTTDTQMICPIDVDKRLRLLEPTDQADSTAVYVLGYF